MFKNIKNQDEICDKYYSLIERIASGEIDCEEKANELQEKYGGKYNLSGCVLNNALQTGVQILNNS